MISLKIQALKCLVLLDFILVVQPMFPPRPLPFKRVYLNALLEEEDETRL